MDNQAGLQRLAQAVIVQAAKDAMAGSQEAAGWLAESETADTWLDLAGLDSRTVASWVEAGCKTDLSKNGRGRAKGPNGEAKDMPQMMATRVIRIKPEPACPDCGARMVLRKPPPGKDWEPFWGCNRFPDCRGKRTINPDGTPESDDDWNS